MYFSLSNDDRCWNVHTLGSLPLMVTTLKLTHTASRALLYNLT